MPRLRVGDRKFKKYTDEGEVVVDVRKNFTDVDNNPHAKFEAMTYVPVVVTALQQKLNVMVVCDSGLARSQYVAFLAAAEYKARGGEDLIEEDLDMSYVKERRPNWLDDRMQVPKVPPPKRKKKSAPPPGSGKEEQEEQEKEKKHKAQLRIGFFLRRYF